MFLLLTKTKQGVIEDKIIDKNYTYIFIIVISIFVVFYCIVFFIKVLEMVLITWIFFIVLFYLLYFTIKVITINSYICYKAYCTVMLFWKKNFFTDDKLKLPKYAVLVNYFKYTANNRYIFDVHVGTSLQETLATLPLSSKLQSVIFKGHSNF